MKNKDKRILIAFRILMGAIVGFEFLNWIGVLDFTLDFSWHGLLMTDLFAWIATEMVIAQKKEINLVITLPAICLAVYLDTFGDMMHLYSRVYNYDKYLHFFISSILAYVIYESLRDKLYKDHISRNLSSMIIIAITSMLGMLYEIQEYLEDLLINKKLLRMGNSYDTGGDLLMDFLGGSVVVMILLFIKRKKRKF